MDYPTSTVYKYNNIAWTTGLLSFIDITTLRGLQGLLSFIDITTLRGLQGLLSYINITTLRGLHDFYRI